MSENAQLAGTVVSTAQALGVSDFVICAGARNAPLIADLDSRRGIVLWNHFDERSAAFFALGLAKTKRTPVAVVTTSGTAVAELLPATIEASYSGIPLVLITADRPVSFRGSGAPQAIEQAGIFGGYVSQFLDLEYGEEYSQEITWDRQSPIHLNVCFDEPGREPTEIGEALRFSLENPNSSFPGEIGPPLENPIVLVGELDDELREKVTRFLTKSRIPAWFEATSGLREHPELIPLQIGQESEIIKMAPKEVIRIGGVPSLRYWRDLEKTDEIRVINLSWNRFSGLARKRNVTTLPFSKIDDLTGYSPGPNRVQSAIQHLSAVALAKEEGTVGKTLDLHPESEPSLIAELSKIIPGTAAIFLGNSLPIREWNLAATREVPHPLCFANRGANGIDGEVSTFLGMSREFEESWGIFGDLTALYDLNAPWILKQLPAAKRRIVVLNNGGGRIFSRLPAMKNLGSGTIGLTQNHHQTSFRGWADLWELEYHAWGTNPEKWTLPENNHAVIEIKISQEKSEAFWDDFSS